MRFLQQLIKNFIEKPASQGKKTSSQSSSTHLNTKDATELNTWNARSYFVEAVRKLISYFDYKDQEANDIVKQLSYTFSETVPELFTRHDLLHLKEVINDAGEKWEAIFNTITTNIEKGCKSHDRANFINILLSEGKFNHATRILGKYKPYTADWQHIETIVNKTRKTRNLSPESRQTLIKLLKILAQDWVKRKSKDRPDRLIRQALEIMKEIYTIEASGNEKKMTGWSRWFGQFWGKYSSLRNLKKELVRIGFLQASSKKAK